MRTIVCYSVTGCSRAVAEGLSGSLEASRCELRDRFTNQPSGWKRDAGKAARDFDSGTFNADGVSFKRGDTLVLVFPHWGGPVMPAMTGFVRAVGLQGVVVFLVMTRTSGGNSGPVMLLEDEAIRQGGIVGGVFGIRVRWRTPDQLRSAGKKIGAHILRVPAPPAFSLQERLEIGIEQEREAEARCLRLTEMTPNRRLKEWFRRQANDEAAHIQALQKIYRTYAGVVYESQRQPLAPLEPEKVLDYSSLLSEFKTAVDHEHTIALDYEDIAGRFSSQQDVVRQAIFLAGAEQHFYQNMNGAYRRLSRYHPSR